MYKNKKEKCPECGEETLERFWMGINPQRCPKCGHQTKTTKIEC